MLTQQAAGHPLRGAPAAAPAAAPLLKSRERAVSRPALMAGEEAPGPASHSALDGESMRPKPKNWLGIFGQG